MPGATGSSWLEAPGGGDRPTDLDSSPRARAGKAPATRRPGASGLAARQRNAVTTTTTTTITTTSRRPPATTTTRAT